jgi:3-methyladenine DNA glycosylase AlkC
MANLSPQRKQALDDGTAEARNLAECLAVDQAALVRAVLPSLGLGEELAPVLAALQAVSDKGISRQIAAVGEAVGAALDGRWRTDRTAVLAAMAGHSSDTVRSWAAFAVARSDRHGVLQNRLEAMSPFAADRHFGVREWAWLAVRPHVAAAPLAAIEILCGWTGSPDPNIRRFAVESTRPRGVWCEHIALLKSDPAVAEPLLAPLKADPARYVQDSVANWLNDASKTRADWVTEICRRWSADDHPATERIVGRAMRTLRKQQAAT